MTAFELSVRWIDGGGAVGVAVDDRLRERGHLSVANADELTVVVFGTFLDRGALETKHGVDDAVDGARRSDADVAGDLYSAAGMRWLAHASGDFAIVLFDGAAQRLHVARNHAGTRPVFFRVADGGVRVGSDFASTGTTGEHLDEVAVARFLTGHDPEPGHFLAADIATVPSAHVATITPAGVTCDRYWDPDDCPRLAYTSIEDAAPALRELLREVVAESVERFEGPIGMHLTGGIDSAIVSAFTSVQRRTAGRSAPLAYAWQAPAAPGTAPTLDQHLIDVIANDLGVAVQSPVADEHTLGLVLGLDPAIVPVTSTLALEYPVMAAAAADDVSLVVSGWGGDEFVSYHGRHRRTRPGRRTKAAINRAFRRGSTSSASARRPQGFANERVGAAVRQPEPLVEASARARQIALLEAGHLSERTDSWSTIGSAFGLQHAYPLLDRRVVEFVLGLPDACFPPGRELMREVLRDVVPDEVRLNRNKEDLSRWNHSLLAVGRFVTAEGGELAVRPDRMSYLDIERFRAAVTAPKVAQPGKLMRALQFAHDPDGVPLSEIGTSSRDVEA